MSNKSDNKTSDNYIVKIQNEINNFNKSMTNDEKITYQIKELEDSLKGIQDYEKKVLAGKKDKEDELEINGGDLKNIMQRLYRLEVSIVRVNKKQFQDKVNTPFEEFKTRNKINAIEDKLKRKEKLGLKEEKQYAKFEALSNLQKELDKAKDIDTIATLKKDFYIIAGYNTGMEFRYTMEQNLNN